MHIAMAKVCIGEIHEIVYFDNFADLNLQKNLVILFHKN